MSIEKMLLVNIVGQTKNLDRTIVKCIDSKCFHIESAGATKEAENSDFTMLREENPYKETLSKLISIDFGDDLKFGETDFSDIEAMQLDDIRSFVDETNDKMAQLSADIAESQNIIANDEQILTQLKHLQNMDIDMESLFKCKNIHVRFGKLPVDSYVKLKYYGSDKFVFVDYDVDNDFYWGMYFVPVAKLAKADKIFSDLFFERIWVPDYVRGKPAEEIADVQKKYDETRIKLDELLKERSDYLKTNGEKLKKVFCKLKYQYDCFECRSKVSVMKDSFLMVGFIPQREEENFTKLFSSIKGVSVVTRPPDSDENLKIPVKLKTNKFTSPFSMFVEMYGLPSYDGFNPIGLVAVTYTILFGIMFGDLGQGLVIALLGALLYKKNKNKLFAIMTRIGLSSAFFGLMYGSVFGFEHLLDPVYHAIGLKGKPIEVSENIMTVLGISIGIGVFMIIISMVINIFHSLKNKDYEAALFGNNGLIGLAFFVALITGVAFLLLLDKNIFTLPYILICLVLPGIVMMFREPLGCLVSKKKYVSEGIGDFIASNFFELLEFLLGYVSNTLSFIRIGGFVISHASLMAVVMMLSGGSNIFGIILGNIIVIGMEGLLSGIQVLRLEYYEVFSRCYDGDGIEFKPVSVCYEANVD